MFVWLFFLNKEKRKKKEKRGRTQLFRSEAAGLLPHLRPLPAPLPLRPPHCPHPPGFSTEEEEPQLHCWGSPSGEMLAAISSPGSRLGEQLRARIPLGRPRSRPSSSNVPFWGGAGCGRGGQCSRFCSGCWVSPGQDRWSPGGAPGQRNEKSQLSSSARAQGELEPAPGPLQPP